MVLFIVAIAAGLVMGWLRRGSLDALGQRGVWLAWLVPVALAGEIYIVYAVGRKVPGWVWPVHIGAYVLLLAVVAANWRIPGMLVIGLGLLLNAVAIALNGGMMPEAPQTLSVMHAGEQIATGEHIPHTKDVLLPREEARLWWLGDTIATPAGVPVKTVVSAGDVVIAVGLAWTVMALMRPTPPG